MAEDRLHTILSESHGSVMHYAEDKGLHIASFLGGADQDVETSQTSGETTAQSPLPRNAPQVQRPKQPRPDGRNPDKAERALVTLA